LWNDTVVKIYSFFCDIYNEHLSNSPTYTRKGMHSLSLLCFFCQKHCYCEALRFHVILYSWKAICRHLQTWNQSAISLSLLQIFSISRNSHIFSNYLCAIATTTNIMQTFLKYNASRFRIFSFDSKYYYTTYSTHSQFVLCLQSRTSHCYHEILTLNNLTLAFMYIQLLWNHETRLWFWNSA
jgi:hypothetical protein